MGDTIIHKKATLMVSNMANRVNLMEKQPNNMESPTGNPTIPDSGPKRARRDIKTLGDGNGRMMVEDVDYDMNPHDLCCMRLIGTRQSFSFVSNNRLMAYYVHVSIKYCEQGDRQRQVH